MAGAGVLCCSLWIAAVFSAARGCPDLCTCSDKNNRHFAECSYKNLAHVPAGLPPNVTTLSLSANGIRVVPSGGFDNVTLVTSLWMSHNEIVSVERGALTPLVRLRNFDISHNKMADFPWRDLRGLTALQLLKMNHNELVQLPRDAFADLRDLRSIRLNDNHFLTLAEGTFDRLDSLSYLQIYNNPFACTCALDWLRDWISTTTIAVPEQSLIVCASPQKHKGKPVGNLPGSKCTSPNVTIRLPDSTFYEGGVLVLTCDVTGNPEPLVTWTIHGDGRRQELTLPLGEDDSAELDEDSSPPAGPVKVYRNGTLVVPHLRKEDGGNYSCSAANAFGRADDWLSVDVADSPKPTTATPAHAKRHTHTHRTRTAAVHSGHLPDLRRKDAHTSETPAVTPSAEIRSVEATKTPSRPSKCALTANTRFVSDHALNGSAADVKQYTFDFGVVALGVSETAASVRLNPLLMHRDASDSPRNVSEETRDGARVDSSRLYLCISAEGKHSAVQWSRVEPGVDTYLFNGLRPGTNYSLCLTSGGDDCEIQVMFTTRRKIPNLLVIVSVSICLLTVSTVPLLGATCFHMVYRYRSKTYKLILKAKDPCQTERTAHFSVQTPKIDGSLDEEDGEEESVDGEKEADTEESVVTESLSLSQCRGHSDDCEVGSEYSDRLPLGAEAVNIAGADKRESVTGT